MNRQQLEHILRAAASITGAEELVVIGSQAILGAYPNAPEVLLESIEADVFTFRSGQDANLIDGTIGENSPFHRTFGYYARCCGGDRDSADRLEGPPGTRARPGHRRGNRALSRAA